MSTAKHDIIEELQKEVEIPEVVQKRADEAFAAIRKQEKQETDSGQTFRRHMPGKKIWVACAAAVLMLGTVTAGAAAYMQWSNSFTEGMRITEEQKKKLEDNETAASVNLSDTDQGITITAVQTIVDSYYAKLVFKVEGYELPEGAEPAFEDIVVTVGENGASDREEEAVNWCGSFYNGIVRGEDGRGVYADGTPLPEDDPIIEKYVMEDGSMEYTISLMDGSHTRGYFIDKPIHVEFKNMGTYADKLDYAPDIEGNWSFDWTLKGSDDIRECQLEAPLGDTGATVISAEISPISIRVVYDFPMTEVKIPSVDEDGNECESTSFAEAPTLTGVKMKDGTLYPYLCSGGGSIGYEGDDKQHYVASFSTDRILDVENIEGLLFIKSSPEEEGKLTEDNLYVVPLE